MMNELASPLGLALASTNRCEGMGVHWHTHLFPSPLLAGEMMNEMALPPLPLQER